MTSEAAFQRAFVAVSYFLDRRGAELLEPLDAPGAAALELTQRLAHDVRDQRAHALAAELSRIVAELEQSRAF